MKKIEVHNLDLFYGKFQALIAINMSIEEKKITAMIGPSGCGKSTLLRVFNRMNDNIEGVRVTGDVMLEEQNILGLRDAAEIDLLRRRVGMVFQRPNPFPLSVFENVAFGLRIHQLARGKEISDIVEKSLCDVLLWDALKDKLKKSALTLTLEQKQRLCIARLLAVKPDIILLDEPCSSLDPVATLKIEELMLELKKKYTIIIVTHNMAQAARVSDEVGFMLLGKLVEFGETQRIFTAPTRKETEEYITGRYG
jgi:phosphate transport system ATP-binding protein